VKKTIDIYLAKLNEFVNNTKQAEKKQQKKKMREGIVSPDDSAKKKSRKTNRPNADEPQPTMVERIPEELRFIKRFVNLNGKTKTKEEILRFINSLQKAILEKRIRKTSAYAEQITFVQEKLIGLYNDMKLKIKIELKPETYETLKKLTGEE